ncbi:MAG: hypothetical protein ABIG96_05790 [Candidatus Micrarchaeota archaeon]
MAEIVFSNQAVNPTLNQGLVRELISKKIYILKSIAVLAIFALLQFANQYFFVPHENIPDILIRGFALGGATLIGLSLLIGPLAVLKPKFNFVRHRRAVGNAGFVLIFFHLQLIISQRLGNSPQLIFSNPNPFANGLFMGFLAYFPLVLLFLTSTDWATRKLGQKNWKNLHRLIYASFLIFILHAVIMTRYDPVRLFNPAGYLLLLVSIFAALFQLLAYIKRIFMGHSKPVALYVGAFFIIAYLVIFSAFLFAPNLLIGK